MGIAQTSLVLTRNAYSLSESITNVNEMGMLLTAEGIYLNPRRIAYPLFVFHLH